MYALAGLLVGGNVCYLVGRTLGGNKLTAVEPVANLDAPVVLVIVGCVLLAVLFELPQITKSRRLISHVDHFLTIVANYHIVRVLVHVAALEIKETQVVSGVVINGETSVGSDTG
jgi:hypothetical protein